MAFYRCLHFSRDPNLLHDDMICVENRFLVTVSPQRCTRKGLPAVRPQGAAASRGGRPLAGRLSIATRSVTACARAAVTTQEDEGEG
ncbi:hypothetical protein B296_00022568 [Ensete ventricosum]|uniref:Uncharacterized protein n=1 Tax=Ensete ventricosum TaxID=4639 RepID=A0A427A7R3_ENSVE|nr:hypothetical protein B296_00022568 [Ensete ventricosum]